MNHRPVPHGLVDGLRARNDGAVDNGTIPAPTVSRPRLAGTAAGPVRIVREPAGAWRCDTCRRTGYGWIDIESHFAALRHRSYTELEPPAGVTRNR